MIDDQEFSARRQGLDQERMRLEEHLRMAREDKPWFEHADALILFCNRAVSWYRVGDPQIKRQIVNAVSSNLTLMDKKVLIEARKPFAVFSKNDSRSSLCAARDAVSTVIRERDPEVLKTIEMIKAIIKSRDEDDSLPKAA
jgi:hypothetical protein